MIDCSDTFLSSLRTSDEQIAAESKAVSMSVNVETIINAMPCFVAVLDENQQIVFCNQALLSLVNADELGEILGKRTDEVLQCAFVKDCDADCGTTPYCKYCGAAQAIKQCQENGENVVKECRMSSVSLGALDLSVVSSPLDIEGTTYTLLSITDISDSKRRASLERSFFHDITNSASCVKSALDVMGRCDDIDEIKHFSALASTASLSLMDEIESQKVLLAAESHELNILLEKYTVADIFRDLKEIWLPYAMSFDVQIAFASEVDSIKTDIVLIKRIVGNLVKNAIEASNIGDLISVSCFLSNEKKIVVSINNPVPLPEKVLSQMFQRSFSTKGVGRGLGTYSVKLLTEEYLKGSVSVVTNNDEGTTVFITL